MAQGFSRPEVQNILEDVDSTNLIDEKTRHILRFAEKITRHAHRVAPSDIQTLKDIGCSEEDIFEAIAVTSLLNFMDRMADALGAPVEDFQKKKA